MKRSDLHLFLCAVCACACASCNDDGAAATEDASCADSAQCAENQVCIDGKCKPPADLGEACNADADCGGDYACRQNVCVKIAAKGNACGGETACADSLRCIGGICAAELSQGDSCTPNAPADVCADGLKCIARVCAQVAQIGEKCTQGVTQCETGATCANGICKKQEITNPPCESAADCPESKPDCHENGYCVKYAEHNAYCDESEPCRPGLECYYYTCAQYAERGESCDDDANIYCVAGHYCSDGKCEKAEFSLQKGETCNGIWLFCGDGLDCRDGICAQIVGENEACDEAQHIFCQAGNLACHHSVCAPISGDCQTSADCAEKDSYCCTDDSCGAVKNKCVVYDEKTRYDEACKYETKPGIFEAQIQCRWQPASNDYPNAKAAEMPPIVGRFGNKDDVATTVVILSTPNRNQSTNNVLRVINAETCETLESIPGNGFNVPAWGNYPAAADLDNDGLMEILVARSGNTHIQAFKWNAEQKKHVVWWESEISATGNIMVFDINGDGLPEVLNGTTVVNGQTGKTIFKGEHTGSTYTVAVGYLDNDPNGYASMLMGKSLLKWNGAANKWDTLAVFPHTQYHAGYADFGTPGETAEAFDFSKLDGKPEFVLAGNSALRIYAAKLGADGNYVLNADGQYEVQEIMSVKNFNLGGPVTIGDFDNDGLPEVAVASKNAFGVYDPRCKGYNNPEGSGCADASVLWERWSQDVSSGVTGSSLFDFDGDGQPEAVYGDECFVRVYEGNTGRVLFSAKRSSYTSFEAPTIADVDGDGSAEILMTSDRPYRSCYDDTTPAGWTEVDGEDKPYKPRDSTDPIHEGIRCVDDEDCPTSKNCSKAVGLCLCESDSDCNTQYIKRDGQDVLFEQYKCMAPLHPQVGFYTYSETDKKRVQAVPKGTRPEGWKEGDYKVCRASRKLTDYGNEDLVIYKDRLDRWVSSRNIWNQHAYNIINIEDDGSIPSRASWWGNWIREKLDQYINGTQQRRREYNSYRLNKQGLYGAGTVPDITGRFETDSICGKTYTNHPDASCAQDADCADNRVCRDGVCADMRYVIGGKLCNRGTKPVSMNLPASFYFYDETKENKRGDRICTSYTKTPVGVGQCDKVGCEVAKDVFDALIGKDVLMITNENEYGFRSTDECNYNNNNDRIRINACAENIVIVN